MISLEAIYPNDLRRQFHVVRAFSKMYETNDGKILIEFLKECAEYTDRINRASIPPQLQWNQGAAQFLEFLNTLAQEAGPLALKIKEAVEARENTAAGNSLSKF